MGDQEKACDEKLACEPRTGQKLIHPADETGTEAEN